MSVSARLLVSPPAFTAAPYGLLSAVDLRTEADGHWQMGVTWEDVCGGVGTTVADCVTSAPIVTGGGLIPLKSATATRTLWGATPFTVYVEVDCSPVDFYERRDEVMQAALNRFESIAVERAFWTGVAMDRNGVGGFANAVLPHLAANAAVSDTQGLKATQLQLAATVVTGVALNVVNALGALEGALAQCVGGGVGFIHVPQALAPDLALLTTRQGNRLLSPNGNVIVIGGGYPGTSPTGAAPALGTSWMYATGPVFAYRSAPNMRLMNDPASAPVDRNVDTVKAIIERNYVLGYDCCLLAQLVNTASFIATSTTAP